MFEISGFHKIAELDNFEEGCIEGINDSYFDMHISAQDVPALVKQIISFIGAEDDSVSLDSCEEVGRIDIQKTENAEGNDPTARELSDWKAGRINLYAVTYTCYVEEVTRNRVKLSD